MMDRRRLTTLSIVLASRVLLWVRFTRLEMDWHPCSLIACLLVSPNVIAR